MHKSLRGTVAFGYPPVFGHDPIACRAEAQLSMNRRNILSVGALMATALLVSLVLAELVLRLYAAASGSQLANGLRADPYAILVEPHGVVGYRPRPAVTIPYDNGTAANINTMGFRGPAIPTPKPPSTFRVVLLGGSTTFGWGVNDDETIDAYMREMLAAQYPGRVIEVANLAFDGYDSYQLYERFRSDVLDLEPDAVIVNTGVNDVRNARYPKLQDRDPRTLLWLADMTRLRDEEARGGPRLWTRAKHHFYLARLPGRVRQRVAVSPDTIVMPHPDALDYFERNLRRLVELGTSGQSSVVLLSTPPSSLRTLYAPNDPPTRSYWIRDAETTQTYRDSLSARMRSVAVEAKGRGEAVEYVTHEELDPSLFLDDAHLTPAGNRRVAEEFVRALRPWLARQASVRVGGYDLPRSDAAPAPDVQAPRRRAGQLPQLARPALPIQRQGVEKQVQSEDAVQPVAPRHGIHRGNG